MVEVEAIVTVPLVELRSKPLAQLKPLNHKILNNYLYNYISQLNFTCISKYFVTIKVD